MTIFLALLAAGPLNCSAPSTQYEMTRCAQQEADQADAEMTRQWKITYAVAKNADEFIDSWDKRPSNSAALLAAQRSWIAFKEKHCTVVSFHSRGGSLEPMIYAACIEELTDQRTSQLRDIEKSFR